MTEQEKKDLVFASSFYLFKSLPNHFIDWEEDKLNKWIEEHAWQPFENWTGEDLWVEIEKLADGVRQYINKEDK
jgi:hypothetical protein